MILASLRCDNFNLFIEVKTMKRETRKMVLLNQIDLMRELVDANPEFTEDAINNVLGCYVIHVL